MPDFRRSFLSSFPNTARMALLVIARRNLCSGLLAASVAALAIGAPGPAARGDESPAPELRRSTLVIKRRPSAAPQTPTPALPTPTADPQPPTANPDSPTANPDSTPLDPHPRPTVRYTDGRTHINRAPRTLGGVQLWGDEFWWSGWRIQRNVATGHCRLLDPDNRREEWGSFDSCLVRFDELKVERNIPPMSGRAVILLHGLGGWHSTMQPLANYLKDNSDFTVVNLTYPSTRADIAAQARALAGVVEHLEGIAEIDFVAHSLGNVIVRHYLGDQTDPAKGRAPDPRIKRFVMLAPPNHGSERADKWSDRELFVAVLGASALQLGAGWAELDKRLAAPAFEFGIIAGGRGDDRGYSSRLAGDDDNTISVETTRLPGARDFKIVPVWHSFLILSPTVHRMTLEFLEHGYFVSEAERTPIAPVETR
jgi:pimeloyl-ACP methyl ester carboxylesterase